MRTKNELRSYQRRLADEIKNKDRLLLAVDMGLGKTISTLTAIEEMNKEFKVLIVGPKRVAQVGWPDELKEWEHLQNLSYKVIKGTSAQRQNLLKIDTQITIINRELIVWLYEQDVNFDIIVWDESSSLKGGNLKTKTGNLSRFGALMKLANLAKKVILLTGTPSSNGLEDLYGQITVLKPGLLEKSKYQFFQKYFKNVSWTRDYPIWQPIIGSFETVMKLSQDYIIKMKTQDYLTLPEFLSLNTYIEFDSKEKKIYKDFENNLITEEQDVVASNPAVLVNKLLQLTSGCMYKEDGSYNIYHSLKLDALEELIEENPNENILLFYNFKHEREQLEKRFKDIVFLKKDEDISNWNAGKIKILACHPQSAGHGLNLQHGGNTMAWLSLPWSLEIYQQANKRLHRSGQKNNVKCYHLLLKDTVDEQVLGCLQGKTKTQDLIFKLMRELK